MKFFCYLMLALFALAGVAALAYVVLYLAVGAVIVLFVWVVIYLTIKFIKFSRGTSDARI